MTEIDKTGPEDDLFLKMSYRDKQIVFGRLLGLINTDISHAHLRVNLPRNNYNESKADQNYLVLLDAKIQLVNRIQSPRLRSMLLKAIVNRLTGGDISDLILNPYLPAPLWSGSQYDQSIFWTEN